MFIDNIPFVYNYSVCNKVNLLIGKITLVKFMFNW